jgi:hypothetical protein
MEDRAGTWRVRQERRCAVPSMAVIVLAGLVAIASDMAWGRNIKLAQSEAPSQGVPPTPLTAPAPLTPPADAGAAPQAEQPGSETVPTMDLGAEPETCSSPDCAPVTEGVEGELPPAAAPEGAAALVPEQEGLTN